MDAKTEAHAIRCAFIDQPDMVLFSREYMFQIATLLESQARDAESGQIANNLCCETFKFDYRDEDCMDCGMRSYCRLRAGKEAE